MSTLSVLFAFLAAVFGHHAQAPDITYAPCAWFSNHHVIPAYTYTDRCINAAGKIVHR